MKLDFVVIVCQHHTVNMPLLLAHTARQTIRAGFERGRLLLGRFELRFGKEG